MTMKKTILLSSLFSLIAVYSSNATLLITGISDGNETGGVPKSLEVYTTTDIADLSAFLIAKDTNGVGPWDTFAQLPSVSLSAGSFFYIAGTTDSETYLNGSGFAVGFVHSILNVNGDDIIGLATAASAASVYDSVGGVAQGDTDFYANSFAVRRNTSTSADLASTDAANFSITSWDTVAFAGASGYGSYSPIPEPSSFALLGLGSLVTLHRRKR
jgi:hypothetical protein